MRRHLNKTNPAFTGTDDVGMEEPVVEESVVGRNCYYIICVMSGDGLIPGLPNLLMGPVEEPVPRLMVETMELWLEKHMTCT
jgi:hypothetical protein